MNQLAEHWDRLARGVNLSNPAMARATLLICACSLFAVALFSQTCSDMVVPTTTLTSGSPTYQSSNCIGADQGFIVNGANVTFNAGSYIHLRNGFHASAPSSGTRLHALIT